MKTQKPDKGRVVSLADLAPRADVKGGASVRVFGQDPVPAAESTQPARRPGSRTVSPRKKS